VAAGAVAVEYRMRSFLGEESVRADNALALAAEQGRFEQLRRELFASQPPEHSGGFASDDLVALGERAGLTSSAYIEGVREGRYEHWVRRTDDLLQDEDPDGTPQATLDGEPVDPQVLYDPETLGGLLRAKNPRTSAAAQPGPDERHQRIADDQNGLRSSVLVARAWRSAHVASGSRCRPAPSSGAACATSVVATY
jgi:hypothetical protein